MANNKYNRQFDPAHKKEIVPLVAKDIDVTPQTVRNWVKQYGKGDTKAFPGKGHLHPADEELRQMKKQLKDLEEERDPKTSYSHLHKRREIGYQFIKVHRSVFSVKEMCRILQVMRSAFYDWMKRPQSRRKAEDETLKKKITKIFLASDRTYGHRRIKKRLRR
jgi:putative transposase